MAAGFTQGVGGSAQFILTDKVHCTCVKKDKACGC